MDATRITLLLFLVSVVVASYGCNAPDTEAGNGAGNNLATLLGAEAAAGFRQAEGAREFEFPADHGPHAGYRNEWWYLTGNLDGADGERYGYELTLFRFSLLPDTVPASASRWSANDVFVGHFAITDAAAKQFHVAEAFARGAAGLAGATSPPLRVWINNWQLRHRQVPGKVASWSLSAASTDMRIELTLEALKPPVLNGEGGYSRKSAGANNASYYYSMPRLQTTGEIVVGNRRIAVSGLSWLDREWSSSALAADQAGWDWFALQLDDGTDLMFYQLRKSDGTIDAFSSGSIIAPDGSSSPLPGKDVILEVLGNWRSPDGTVYPQGWRLQVPGRNLDLRIHALQPDQELATWVRYWEGAVDVTGTYGSTRVAGRGYVELTGYAAGEQRAFRR